jgi:hypothetical protein
LRWFSVLSGPLAFLLVLAIFQRGAILILFAGVL